MNNFKIGTIDPKNFEYEDLCEIGEESKKKDEFNQSMNPIFHCDFIYFLGNSHVLKYFISDNKYEYVCFRSD